MDLLHNLTDRVAAGALDGLAARQRAISNNIANVDTPGFQPGEVSFEDQLRTARQRAERTPGGAEQPFSLNLDAQTQPGSSIRSDGNGVSIDREVVRMAETTLTYEGLTRALKLRGEIMRSAISEGKK